MKHTLLFSIAAVALLTACGNEPAKQDPVVPGAPTETPAAEKTKVQDDAALTREPKENLEARKVASENKVMDQVWNIPEVAELDKSIRQKSKGKRGISTFISGEPSDDQEYYLVSVAEDNGDAMATYYQFCIYPDYSVRFYDVATDEIITLKEWRRRKSEEPQP